MRSVMDLARDERKDLADFLDTLTPEQWAAPTLCDGWSVRDVVAHVVSYEGLGALGLAKRLVKGRFLLGRINDVGIGELRHREPAELVALLRQHVHPAGLTAGFEGRVALVDEMVHQQDIRRPLGLPRDVPAERLRAALSFALVAPPIMAPWHIRGVKVVATDVDWSGGVGAEARGPGEAVLMAMAGRRGAAQELCGPGADRLVGRLG